MDKKIDECLEVCSKTSGCTPSYDTHKICKINNSNAYHKLNQLFEE